MFLQLLLCLRLVTVLLLFMSESCMTRVGGGRFGAINLYENHMCMYVLAK